MLIDKTIQEKLSTQEIDDLKRRATEFEEMIYRCKPVWYRRIFPFLPIWYQNKAIRLFVFQLFDCSVTAVAITKLHLLDLLEFNHRKWWQPKYIGFQIWY
jgi:hypothetical protein